MTDQACPVCAAVDSPIIFSLRDIPVVCNQLLPDPAAAKAAPKGDIELSICRDCALIWNTVFDPGRIQYAPGYENALHFSPNFQDFAKGLASNLVSRYCLAGKDIVEVGCGDGYMLDLMVKYGVRYATGYDPSVAKNGPSRTLSAGVEIVPEYFRREQLGRAFDAVICRHVLEHISQPIWFMTEIRHAVGDSGPLVYVEVPNAGWMLDAVSMWDVIYEHVSYWTAPAIETLFRRTGFDPISISAGYGEQFLMVEAKPTTSNPEWYSTKGEAIQASAHAFAAAANAELNKWRKRLKEVSGSAVIWGAGSKGITFANALNVVAEPIRALVDLNPRKHGLFAPGIGVPVVSPEELKEIRPELVLISNAIYKAEITAQLHSLGLTPEIDIIAG